MGHHPEHMYPWISPACVKAQILTRQGQMTYSSDMLKQRRNYFGWWLVVLLIPVVLSTTSSARASEDAFQLASEIEVVEDPLKVIPPVKPGTDILNLIPYRTVFAISDLLRLPSDVGVDGQGRIYILDGTANTVRVYDDKGKGLFTIGDSKTLKIPLGLDVSPKGDVLVADSGNHRVVLFPAGGAAPRFFDLPAQSDEKPTDPTDVVFARDLKKFFVVDNDNHRVTAFDLNGKILWTTGKMGRNPEQFRFPFLMDIDGEDNIYVVEVVNTRVQVLNPDGSHRKFIGDWGIEEGQFFRPKGIAVDPDGEVLVSDSYLGVIQTFTLGGEFVGAVGDEAGNLRKFTTPMGMTVFGNRLLVIEMYTNRLVVLEREGP